MLYSLRRPHSKPHGPEEKLGVAALGQGITKSEHIACTPVLYQALCQGLHRRSHEVYNNPEAGGLTIPFLQIRKMWLRPKAVSKPWLFPGSLCFLERELLLLRSQESELSCPLNWEHSDTCSKAQKP